MKVLIITLGCKVNTYESDAIKEMFLEYGDEIVTDNDDFDTAIINTCTVTNQASAKSRKMIRNVIKRNNKAIIGVIGCYSQMFADEVKEIKGVDFILGNVEKTNIVELVHSIKDKKEVFTNIQDILRYKKFENLNPTSFTHTRAFLKIEDGCNNFCSYCIIPFSRGPVRSKAATEIIKDINKIVENGYKEVVLTGIHTGRYQDQDIDFTKLVKMILEQTKLERVRVSSIEPNEIKEEFIQMMKNDKRIAHHLHIPLQAGSDHVLSLMNRKYNKQFYIDLVKHLKEEVKDISITTDIIVGFPEETEDDFNETLELSKELEFAKIHVFPFSLRKGTKACSLKQVKDSIKDDRVKQLLELDNYLENKYKNKNVGSIQEVIFEEINDNYYVGHSSNYLPICVADLSIKKGSMHKVEIIKYENDKLIGKVID